MERTTIYKKEIELLKLFENHLELSLDEINFFLETNSNLSKKYINNLNTFLKVKKLGEIISNGKKNILESNLDDIIYNKDIPNITYDPKERFYYIIILLIFEDKIKIVSLVPSLDTTMNTLLEDLNKVKFFLKKFNLTVTSTPFSGVSLEGAENSKINFSINILLKYLLEKEFNPKTFDLFSIYINPLLSSYLNKKFEHINMESIERIIHEIIIKLRIDSDIYFYTTLKAILLYFSTKKIEYYHFGETYFSGRKKIIYFELLKINSLKNNNYLNSSIFMLVKIIFRHTSRYSLHFMEKNKIFNILSEKIERIYKISLTIEEENTLFDMIKKFEYKYLFEIKNYDNNYITNSDIPKSILNDLGYTFKKNNFKILKEDLFIISLYVYHLVCNYYLNNNFKKNFLICDYSNHCWIGNGFVNEIKKYLPNINTHIISICSLKFENLNFDDYDYVIFMNKFQKSKIFLNEKLKEKAIFINYKDHFEINSFWGHLIFGREIED